MTEKERIIKLCTASPAVLARVDAILNGTDTTTANKNEDCRLVTHTEAARRLGVSRPTVYRLVRLGKLSGVKLTGVSRIRLQSIFDYLDAGFKY